MKRIFKYLSIATGLARRDGPQYDAAVDEAIERVIDGTDPRLRLVPGYRKKLQRDIAASLDHIGNLVDQIPGPLEVSRKTFVSDPEVRAFFASPDELQEIFSSSTELKTFFADPANMDFDECSALLCANKEEKTVLGTDLAGDSVHHDVLQTAINFYDHKILSPAAHVKDVRDGIKQCIFDGLVTHALERIYKIRTHRQNLEDQRRILHSRLRARQAQGNGLSALLAAAHEGKEQPEDLKEQLAEAERKLDQMPGTEDALSFYLDEVRKILGKPDDFIRLNVACFRLTDMGVMVNDNSPQTVNTVCFSELEIADVMRRVVTVVRFGRAGMESQDSRL